MAAMSWSGASAICQIVSHHAVERRRNGVRACCPARKWVNAETVHDFRSTTASSGSRAELDELVPSIAALESWLRLIKIVLDDLVRRRSRSEQINAGSYF